MNLNFNQLKIFLICGKHRTFSEAAKKLFLSQPAVTMQIKQLEAYLGTELFSRGGKTVQMTNAGRILFEYAQKIFDLTEAGENAVKELNKLKTRDLKIGTLYIYARFMLQSLISQYQTKYPCVHVVMDEGNSDEITQSLLDYKNDLGLISAKSPAPRQLEIIPYCRDELVLILPRNHRLSKKSKIFLTDLANEPLLIQRRGVAREMILQKYQEAGISPNTLIEASNLGFLIEQVEAGEGISFTSIWAVKDRIERGTLTIRTLADGPYFIDISVAYLKNRILSPSAVAFIDLLIEQKDILAPRTPATHSEVTGTQELFKYAKKIDCR